MRSAEEGFSATTAKSAAPALLARGKSSIRGCFCGVPVAEDPVGLGLGLCAPSRGVWGSCFILRGRDASTARASGVVDAVLGQQQVLQGARREAERAGDLEGT